MTIPSHEAPAAVPRKPRRDELLEVRVERIDPRGGVRGRASHPSGEYEVHLRRGVPGARVLAQVSRRRGGRIEAREIETLEPSPAGARPRCAHFGACGGCSHQDLVYPAQLAEKRRMAERILFDAGLLEGPGAPAVERVVPCDGPWGYRNKMDFTFASRRWVEEGEEADVPRDFALGLHPAGRYGKVVDVRECAITFPEAGSVLASARRLALERGLEPWDLSTRTGLLRHLVLRKSESDGEVLANLVTSEEAPGRVGPYARALLAERPEITTLVQTINALPAAVAAGEREVLLHGRGFLRERILGLAFRVSAASFFQTNSRQAARLVRIVREEAAPSAQGVLFDLYCGAGLIALALAGAAREVWGFELAESAVLDARRNAADNGAVNVRFVAGDVARSLEEPSLPEPEVIVADPPRAGLHPRVAESLARTPARRLVYVSCNLRAAARDAALLRRAGWRLVRVQPIDLFPHTPHLECVLTLERAP